MYFFNKNILGYLQFISAQILLNNFKALRDFSSNENCCFMSPKLKKNNHINNKNTKPATIPKMLLLFAFFITFYCARSHLAVLFSNIWIFLKNGLKREFFQVK